MNESSFSFLLEILKSGLCLQITELRIFLDIFQLAITCQLVRNIRFYQISFSDPQLLQIVLKHFLDLAIESEDRSENSFSVLLLLLIV